MNFKDYLDNVKEPINEASFNAKKLEKVVILYSKILGRKMGGTFKKISQESYQRRMGPGRGIRMMNDRGEMLRFNWDAKMSKDTSYVMTSIDYWEKTNKDFQKPTRTVMFGPNLNVIQVLDHVVDALKLGKINEEFLSEEKLAFLNEAKRTKEEKQEWLVNHGMIKSYAGSEKAMRKYSAQAGLLDELEIFLGTTETNTFEEELKTVEKQFTKEVFADPETVFEDIEDLLSVVAAGKWRTLIVCGQGGIGKCVQGETMLNIEGL